MKKKIINMLLLVIGVILITPNTEVNALTTNDALNVDWSKSIRVVKEWNGRLINTTEEVIYRASDGKYVYCMQPDVLIQDGSTVAGYSDTGAKSDLSGLSQATIEKMEMIAYYGYGYGSHNDLSWYWATQIAIWKTANPNYLVCPAADSTSLTCSNEYDSKINEIMSLVNNHYDTVSFNKQEVTLKVGESITLTDTHNVLPYLNVVNNDNLTMSKNGNKLTITAKKPFEGTITLPLLQRRDLPLIYTGAGQLTMSIGDPDWKTGQLSINITTPLEITKYYGDDESGVWKYEKNAIFQIINKDTNEVIGTITTDSNGSANTELRFGTYIVHQIEGKENYNFIKDYTFTIDGSEEKEVQFYKNKLITSDLEFTKTDFSTGEVIPNTKISIYNTETDEIIFTGKTDENGKIIVKNIPKGKYYILETEAAEGYILNDEKMYFEVTTSKNEPVPRFKITIFAFFLFVSNMIS